MKTLLLSTLAAVLLIGCSEDEVTTAPEVDSALVEDTGSTTTETSPGDDTSTPSDGTTEETSMEDGSTTDAPAADAPATDAPAADAPAGDTASGPTIKCGATTCNPSTQACCLNVAGVGSCIAKAGSCMGVSSKFECSDGDTCGSGQKCCATIGLTGSSSQCKASCATGEVQLCDSNDECTGGAMCSAITGTGSSTGYSRCP